MANTTFQLKRTSTPGNAPNTEQIAIGELAINLPDGIMYSTNGSVVFEIGANNTNASITDTLTVNAVSANGSTGSAGQVLTTNGSNVYWSAVSGGGGGTVTQVNTGIGLTGGPIDTTGTISVNPNTGIIANASGLFVNATYIATLDANNASYLGGLTSSQFLRSDADDTATGIITFSANVNSSATLDANVITVDTLQILGGNGTQGTITWNTDEETIDIVQNGAVLQVGQEIYYHVKNQTGNTIPDGTAVMATGTLGASGRITVAPMIANGSVLAKYYLGVTTEDIEDGGDGKVTHFGKIRGLDLTTYNEGDVLWLDPSTAGGFTTTEPQAPNLKIATAFVISNTSPGTMMVRSNIGYKLEDLHDVEITSATNNQILVYDDVDGRWENRTVNTTIIDEGTNLYYTIARANSAIDARVTQSFVNALNVDAATVGGNTATDLNNYADTAAGTAYSNATSYADTAAGTAYSNATSYADTAAGTAYSNAVSAASTDATNKAANAYSNAVSTAASDATSKAATAYSNAVSYADSIAATAYSNATSYADTAAGTAYSNAVSYAGTIAGTAYSNATSYADTIAGTAYSNATSYADGLILDSVTNTSISYAASANSVKTAYDHATTIAGTAYSNATSYADTIAGTAYSNATSYADTAAGTAYSNATSYADTAAGTAYSNATSYADTIAGTAYSNAVSYVGSQSFVNTSQLSSNLSNYALLTGADFTGNVTFSEGISANGSYGTDGQVLTSNGTVAYWSTAAGGSGGGYYYGDNGTIGASVNANNIFRVNNNTLNANVTFTSGQNGSAAGPVTVANGFTLEIQSGARVAIV